MPQLLLSPRETADVLLLGEAAAALGWSVHRLPSWRLPAALVIEPALAIYGEPLFARVVAAQAGRVLLEPPPDWLTHLPEWALGRRVTMSTFGEVAGLSPPVFLKPPDDKLFRAGVYEDFAELSRRTDIEAGQQVIVSDPVVFEREFRVHVLEGRPLATSRYVVGGALSVTGDDPLCLDAARFAERVVAAAAAWTPPALVVDVGVLGSGAWAVVEANPVFGAGLYAGRPEAVLEVLLAACRTPADVPEDHRRYLFPVDLE